jgi:hypothetical protein
MDVPWNIIGYIIALFTFFLLLALYRAKKTKNKMYYIGAGVCGSMLAVVVIAALGQYLLSFSLMMVMGVLCMFMLPKMLQTANDEAFETIKNTDTSEPLQLKDVFSWSLIPKLEEKYGKRKALGIYATGTAGLTSVVMLLLYLLKIVSLTMAGVYVAIAFVLAILMYSGLKKGRMFGTAGRYAV